MKSIFSAFMVTLILVSALTLAFDVRPVKASGTIYVRADGSIDPPTANITTTDNVTYTFTDNNYDSIVVERNNIAIDGNGYTLEGTGSEDGMRLSERTNVTVRNARITNFHVGIRLDYSSSNNNAISGNIISNNDYGIFLVSSANNTILANDIENNKYGIYLSETEGNTLFHNNLINNTQQVISVDSTNLWDNGCEGNHWNTYNGTDLDNDGVGDTYLPWEGVDTCPLMNQYWNPGDIDHDLDVDIFDIVRAAGAYDCTPSDTKWNPHCDIAEPYGIISIFDIVRIASSYGKSIRRVPAFVVNNELIYEGGAQFQWLDPHVSYFQYDYWTIWQSVETLLWFERDNATKIIPWLAESYTRGSDGLHYNFTLRQGITFQDGTKFNATAVWFSLNRLLVMDATSGDGLNHGSQSGWMLMQLIDLDGDYFTAMGADPVFDEAWVQSVLDLNFVEIIDEYTVKINIATPTTQFLPIMAGPWAGIVNPVEAINKEYEFQEWDIAEQTPSFNYTKYFVHMAGLGTTYFTVPTDGWMLGTGPYYIDSVVGAPTYRIVLLAYDNYWGGPDNMNLPPAGKERIEKITFRYQPSFATRLLNLKAGAVTGILVPEVNVFSVVDRDKWLDDGELESIVDGAVVHGVFPTLNTWWLDFCTNITNPDGSLRSWQPFADWRLRMAVACSVNITAMNIIANNRLGAVANNIVPPGTFPLGSHSPDIQPTFFFNLTRAEELLIDARDNPSNSFTYYNGTAVPPGIVDNSFGPSFASAKPVDFYVPTGGRDEQTLTTMADNLNAIAIENDLGIMFRVVICVSGQQYTLASQHLIDSYVGGWVGDYNHVLNWLQPMYYSRGTYPTWNQWNVTALDNLYAQAVEADETGDMDELLRINEEMNTLANEMLMYMVWWHDTAYFTRSTWLKGWYVNTVYGVDLWSTMYFEAP